MSKTVIPTGESSPKENPKKRKELEIQIDDKSSKRPQQQTRTEIPEAVIVGLSVLRTMLNDIFDGGMKNYYPIELIKKIIPNAETLKILHNEEPYTAIGIGDGDAHFANAFLGEAIRSNRYDVAEYILGLDETTLVQTDTNCDTPIEVAVLYGQVKLLHLFVSKFKPEWLTVDPDKNGRIMQGRINEYFLWTLEKHNRGLVEKGKMAALLLHLVEDKVKEKISASQLTQLTQLTSKEEKAVAMNSQRFLNGHKPKELSLTPKEQSKPSL